MSIDDTIKILKSKRNIGAEKEEIEDYFYSNLTRFFLRKQFEDFKHLFDYSIEFDIFIDVKKIPRRHEIISKRLTEFIEGAFTGINYQTFLGDQIELLRFCNNYNLFDKDDFSSEDLDFIDEIRRNKLLIANLIDLFGKVSNSFVFYLYKVMPRALYNFFNRYSRAPMYTLDPSQVVGFFNHYSTYGLSVMNLGELKYFLEQFDKFLEVFKERKEESSEELKLIKYPFFNKTILVSPDNIAKNREKFFLKNNYNYYNLSMVLLGGLGPQGHGFMYSTPKGEVIEICSDIKENDAIIVKYKQFLKEQFLVKLKKEMASLLINTRIIENVINYLTGIIDKREVIDYSKKEPILKKIENYLKEDQNFLHDHQQEILDLMKRISNAITLILRKIKMEDQFKTRMNLIQEDKLKSEDIAKLTSLREKSHYDVLRERFFFQNVLYWFSKLTFAD